MRIPNQKMLLKFLSEFRYFRAPRPLKLGDLNGPAPLSLLREADDLTREKDAAVYRCSSCDQVDPMKTEAAKWAQSPLSPPR
jgi:hypothetical protein